MVTEVADVVVVVVRVVEVTVPTQLLQRTGHLTLTRAKESQYAASKVSHPAESGFPLHISPSIPPSSGSVVVVVVEVAVVVLTGQLSHVTGQATFTNALEQADANASQASKSA